MRRLLMFLLLLYSFNAAAEKYRILSLNTSEVTIGGKTLVKGDEFDSSEAIEWKNDLQAIKVLNLSDKNIMLLVGKDFNGIKSRSLKDYIIERRHLSVRGNEEGSHDLLYLLDEISFPVERMLETDCTYILRYRNMGRIQETELKRNSKGYPVLKREQLKVLRPAEMLAELILHYENGEEVILVEDIKIFPLPYADEMK